MSDNFLKIRDNFSSFTEGGGADMYGTSVRIPTHATRSLMSKAPIYFGDPSYPYWLNRYYAKPTSGGVFAADGADSIGTGKLIVKPLPTNPASSKVGHPINKIQAGATILGGALILGVLAHSATKSNGVTV